ncbi:cholesterol 25-hydroxylase-like protein 1, member 1 [Ambystoma mexicanum]|uniref:cholesterol 25-hydroxylase-like protein 1, member 1 n=1 Tax=Ambystoma mexicanum TaxID=8296 RepID=UPI0037E807CE
MNLTQARGPCCKAAGPCSPHPVLLQSLWDYVVCQLAPTVTSPFFPALLAFSCFIAFSLPFAVIDVLGKSCPFLYKYKIQKDKRPTLKMMGLCLRHALYNHTVYVSPAVVINQLWMPVAPLPMAAPTLIELVVEVLGCTLLFDFQYFVWHVLHHRVGWLYKNFHAIHHEYVAPFALSSQYLGSVELLTMGFWSSTNPVLLKCHPLSAWASNVVSIWMSVEDHIGYDFPWSLHRLVPCGLYGGARAHDLHHRKPNTNYAPFFRHWDMICGTTYVEHDKEQEA